MANPQRGEETLAVNDETYTLRLDFDAIAQIEKKFKESFFQVLMNRFFTAKINTTEVAVILHIMLMSGGHKSLKISDVRRLMIEAQLNPTLKAMTNVFKTTFGGDDENPQEPPRETGKGKSSRGGA